MFVNGEMFILDMWEDIQLPTMSLSLASYGEIYKNEMTSSLTNDLPLLCKFPFLPTALNLL